MIHLSPDTKEILNEYGTFITELRGPISMKVGNKNKLTLYFSSTNIGYFYYTSILTKNGLCTVEHIVYNHDNQTMIKY